MLQLKSFNTFLNQVLAESFGTMKNESVMFDWFQGDSGGPAVCKVDGSWVLAGVTSGGSSYCDVNRPSIYTRISTFRSWIHEHSGL